MSKRCDLCGKDPSFGKQVSRLGRGAMHRRVKRRTPRIFYPNVQRMRAMVNGAPRHIHVCTGCIKRGKVVKPSASRGAPT